MIYYYSNILLNNNYLILIINRYIIKWLNSFVSLKINGYIINIVSNIKRIF